ncbi:uncharacterized protein LOC129226725 [Uloborus diversus]|uniref:uncharacterized protein LOC129226725 n=1 Tax=Uloborus diversus TaxID=327109 RepID=UPI002409C545|nr:uncharacterized protein LOC129226725 [Uloborus diversus]
MKIIWLTLCIMSCFWQKSSSQHHQAGWETGFSDQYRSENTLGQYAFGYNEDHTSGGSFRRETSDEFGNKVGSYGLRISDGRVRIVNYVADNNGYRANIYSNEPGLAPQNFGNSLKITKQRIHGVMIPGFKYSGEAPHVLFNNPNSEMPHHLQSHPTQEVEHRIASGTFEDSNPMTKSEEMNKFNDGRFPTSRDSAGGFENRMSAGHMGGMEHRDNVHEGSVESYTDIGGDTQDNVIHSTKFDDHLSYDDDEFRNVPYHGHAQYTDENVQDVTPQYNHHSDVAIPIEKPNSFAEEDQQFDDDLSYYPSNLHSTESSILSERTTDETTQSESPLEKDIQAMSSDGISSGRNGFVFPTESPEKKMPEVTHTDQKNNATVTK